MFNRARVSQRRSAAWRRSSPPCRVGAATGSRSCSAWPLLRRFPRWIWPHFCWSLSPGFSGSTMAAPVRAPLSGSAMPSALVFFSLGCIGLPARCSSTLPPSGGWCRWRQLGCRPRSRSMPALRCSPPGLSSNASDFPELLAFSPSPSHGRRRSGLVVTHSPVFRGILSDRYGPGASRAQSRYCRVLPGSAFTG